MGSSEGEDGDAGGLFLRGFGFSRLVWADRLIHHSSERASKCASGTYSASENKNKKERSFEEKRGTQKNKIINNALLLFRFCFM